MAVVRRQGLSSCRRPEVDALEGRLLLSGAGPMRLSASPVSELSHHVSSREDGPAALSSGAPRGAPGPPRTFVPVATSGPNSAADDHQKRSPLFLDEASAVRVAQEILAPATSPSHERPLTSLDVLSGHSTGLAMPGFVGDSGIVSASPSMPGMGAGAVASVDRLPGEALRPWPSILHETAATLETDDAGDRDQAAIPPAQGSDPIDNFFVGGVGASLGDSVDRFLDGLHGLGAGLAGGEDVVEVVAAWPAACAAAIAIGLEVGRRWLRPDEGGEGGGDDVRPGGPRGVTGPGGPLAGWPGSWSVGVS